MFVAAEHGLPVRTIHPGPHGFLRQRIQDLGSPDVRFVHREGLLHDLHSLCLH
jgi:hypothetical protein